MNDRTPRENYGRLSQTTSKVYRLYAPISRLSSHQQHKARCLRHSAQRWAKEGGSCDQRWDMRSPFFVRSSGCIHLFRVGKIYRMQHFWYNVVMPCFASFSRFRYYFVIGQKYVGKIETSRNWQNMASLHCTTSAAAH